MIHSRFIISFGHLASFVALDFVKAIAATLQTQGTERDRLRLKFPPNKFLSTLIIFGLHLPHAPRSTSVDFSDAGGALYRAVADIDFHVVIIVHMQMTRHNISLLCMLQSLMPLR